MRKGFTLIEMLVVVGIIAVLIGASLASYTAFVRKASRARCVELVSNVQSALEAVHQKEGVWARAILAGNSAGELDATVGAALAKRGVLSLSYRETERDGLKTYELTGNDRLGIISPWAMDVIKRNPSATLATKIPSGGTIGDHRLRYAIDTDDTGITDISTKKVRVRAKACVWCCGADGVFDTKDDVKSWTADQEVK